jgi:hypothetical protein
MGRGLLNLLRDLRSLGVMLHAGICYMQAARGEL